MTQQIARLDNEESRNEYTKDWVFGTTILTVYGLAGSASVSGILEAFVETDWSTLLVTCVGGGLVLTTWLVHLALLARRTTWAEPGTIDGITETSASVEALAKGNLLRDDPEAQALAQEFKVQRNALILAAGELRKEIKRSSSTPSTAKRKDALQEATDDLKSVVLALEQLRVQAEEVLDTAQAAATPQEEDAVTGIRHLKERAEETIAHGRQSQRLREEIRKNL